MKNLGERHRFEPGKPLVIQEVTTEEMAAIRADYAHLVEGCTTGTDGKLHTLSDLLDERDTD